jgi:hypothetical protein
VIDRAVALFVTASFVVACVSCGPSCPSSSTPPDTTCFTRDQYDAARASAVATFARGFSYIGSGHVVGECTAAVDIRAAYPDSPSFQWSTMSAWVLDAVTYRSKGAPNPVGMLLVVNDIGEQGLAAGTSIGGPDSCGGVFVNAFPYLGATHGADGDISCGGIAVTSKNTMLHDIHVEAAAVRVPDEVGVSLDEIETEINAASPSPDPFFSSQENLLLGDGADANPIPRPQGLPESTICTGV